MSACDKIKSLAIPLGLHIGRTVQTPPKQVAVGSPPCIYPVLHITPAAPPSFKSPTWLPLGTIGLVQSE